MFVLRLLLIVIINSLKHIQWIVTLLLEQEAVVDDFDIETSEILDFKARAMSLVYDLDVRDC